MTTQEMLYEKFPVGSTVSYGEKTAQVLQPDDYRFSAVYPNADVTDFLVVLEKPRDRINGWRGDNIKLVKPAPYASPAKGILDTTHMLYRLCGTTVQSISVEEGVVSIVFENGDGVLAPTSQMRFVEASE